MLPIRRHCPAAPIHRRRGVRPRHCCAALSPPIAGACYVMAGMERTGISREAEQASSDNAGGANKMPQGLGARTTRDRRTITADDITSWGGVHAPILINAIRLLDDANVLRRD